VDGNDADDGNGKDEDEDEDDTVDRRVAERTCINIVMILSSLIIISL
jgi:hypothetical protein